MKSPIEERMFEVLEERASFDAHEDPPTAAKRAHRQGVLETLGFAGRPVLLEFKLRDPKFYTARTKRAVNSGCAL